MSCYYRCMLALCLICASFPVVHTQDVAAEDKPVTKALLRRDPKTDQYYVEVQLARPLSDRSKLTALLYDKNKLIQRTADIKDCPPDLCSFPSGSCNLPDPQQASTEQKEFCFRPEQQNANLYFWLKDVPASDEKYTVVLDSTVDTEMGPPITAMLEFKTGIEDNPACYDIENLNAPEEIRNRNNILSILFNLPDKPGQVLPKLDALYVKHRIEKVYDWARTLTQSDIDISLERTAKVEPVPPAPGTPSTSQGGEPEMRLKQVTYQVTNIRLTPNREIAATSNGFALCLFLDKPFPNEDSIGKVVFKKNPPIEFSGEIKSKLTGANKRQSPNASAVAEDKKIAARTLDANLDLGILYSTSVKDIKQGNETVRGRATLGTLDLRFAPWLRRRLDPPRAGVWGRFLTPFFIDAKVSTGSINKDTLSLNRIIIGGEIEFRQVQSTEEKRRNIYRIIGRLSNASDRDFKRDEIRLGGEIRPVLAAFTQPLREDSPFPSLFLPDSGVYYITPGFFGYVIQPFGGVEVGRTYRLARPRLEVEEVSRNVRRAYFGTDVVLNFGPRFTFSLNDTFYVRGESSIDRKHNYFNGKIEGFIGRIAGNTAHSIFLSFERGQQPPFVTPDTNAFTIGYRIRSDLFR